MHVLEMFGGSGTNGDLFYGQLDRLALYFPELIRSLLQLVSGKYD